MTMRSENMSAKQMAYSVAGGAVLCAAAFLALRYRVASATEYIVRTGPFITDVAINKKAVQWPFQTCAKLSISPMTFKVDVAAASNERIPFRMPSVWTIGPKDTPEALQRFAKLMLEQDEPEIQRTIEGVIHGDTRVLTAGMSLNDLFADREAFNEQVVARVAQALEPFGLHVYRANVDELGDRDEKNPYFEQQKRRALQEVAARAGIHVAEAVRSGAVGEKQHVVEQRKRTAELEAEARLVENDRLRQVAESDTALEVARAALAKNRQIAEAEASAAAEQRTLELQRAVEEQRRKQATEQLRAKDYAAAEVAAEVGVRASQGAAEAAKLRADAELYTQRQAAAGILAVKQAEAEGLRSLVESAGGPEAFLRYLVINEGRLEKLAEQYAKSMQGLRPNVHVWTSGEGGKAGLGSTMVDVAKTAMPLFDALAQQTGVDVLGSLGVKPKPAASPLVIKSLGALEREGLS